MRIRGQATPARCSQCGRVITWRDVAFANHPRCPVCGARLRVGRNRALTASLGLAFLLGIAFGARGWWVIVGYLALNPATMTLVLVAMGRFSVETLPPTDVRDILYPIDHTGSEAAEVPRAPDRRSWIGKRAWDLFVGINQPFTIEGVAVQAVLLIVTVWVAWASVTPLLRAVVPDFGATRSGPQGFPVSVHIGSWTVAFTNGSETPWTCRAAVGRMTPGRLYLVDSFEIPAGKTVPVEYTRFNPAGTPDAAEIRRAAQGGITVECREPSGRRHFATLQ